MVRLLETRSFRWNAVESAVGSVVDWWRTQGIGPGAAVLLAGVVLLIVPTIAGISAVWWASEQGAHGPIVLAIAIWMVFREWPSAKSTAQPGNLGIGLPLLGLFLAAYLFSRIVGSIVLESVAAYGSLLAAAYLLIGWRAMRRLWFPLLYFIFVLPLPGGIVATATQPLRLAISSWAVSLLAFVGYPMALSGLLIYIGQYALEVRAACGGLNSITSLSAIGLFYAYIRHRNRPSRIVALLGVSIFMAIFANFLRVIILALITWHLGEAAAQGYLHQFAGLVMFVIALLGTMMIDALIDRWAMKGKLPA